MSIRLLEKGDYYKNYLELMSQLKPTNIYSYSKFEKIFKEIEKNKNHNIFVIEEDNIIVGTVTIVLETKFIYDGDKLGHIEDFAIHKDFRKKGIGRLLINNLYEIAKKERCYKVSLACKDTNLDFYKKSKFKLTGLHMAKVL